MRRTAGSAASRRWLSLARSSANDRAALLPYLTRWWEPASDCAGTAMTGTLVAEVRRAGRPRLTGGSYVCGARLRPASGDGPCTLPPVRVGLTVSREWLSFEKGRRKAGCTVDTRGKRTDGDKRRRRTARRRTARRRRRRRVATACATGPCLSEEKTELLPTNAPATT